MDDDMNYAEEEEQAMKEADAQYSNYDELIEIYEEAKAMYENTKASGKEEWYSERFKIILKYSSINWKEIYDKFNGRDKFICDTVIKINELIVSLRDDYSTRPTFNFINYYSLLHNVKSLWQYYSKQYVGAEDDGDVIDLIAAISFL